MIVLDTDHLSVVVNERAAGHGALMDRIGRTAATRMAITVVTLEEQCRGWLAQINRLKDRAIRRPGGK